MWMRKELVYVCFFFNDTATTESYTLSLHDALPICAERAPAGGAERRQQRRQRRRVEVVEDAGREALGDQQPAVVRSEEHTSELQSRQYLVCRLLLEKKITTSCLSYQSNMHFLSPQY